MSNIKKAFENGKAFIAFITCGDPNLETTAAAVKAAAENGADLIELGIPFSDPTAEGPVIQGANIRALSDGVTTDKIFAFVKELRRDCRRSNLKKSNNLTEINWLIQMKPFNLISTHHC